MPETLTVARSPRRREPVREEQGGTVYEDHPLGDHIVIAPGVCGGRPTFKGTRVEVQVILDWLAAGDSVDDILEGYPSLTRPAVQEALALATRAFLEQNPPVAA